MAILAESSSLKIAGGVFNGISWLIFAPIYACMLVGIAIYSNSFSQNWKVAAALYAKAPLKTLLALLATVCVFGLCLLPQFLLHMLGQILGLLLTPILLLIWFLFVSAQLDRYINPIYFPTLVGRGLYQQTTDKTEKEDLCAFCTETHHG